MIILGPLDLMGCKFEQSFLGFCGGFFEGGFLKGGGGFVEVDC